jgi:hypothetical protein
VNVSINVGTLFGNLDEFVREVTRAVERGSSRLVASELRA